MVHMREGQRRRRRVCASERARGREGAGARGRRWFFPDGRRVAPFVATHLVADTPAPNVSQSSLTKNGTRQ